MKKLNLVNVVIVGAAAYFLFQFLRPRKKQYALDIVKKGNSSSYDALIKYFQEGFLKQWAYASNLGLSTFDYEGKTYVTKGGGAKR